MLPRRIRHFVTQVPCPPTIAPVRPSLSVAPDKHHSFALIGNQEYDPVILERSADLIARALVHLEAIFRLQARLSAVRDTKALSASVSCVQPSKARAARVCRAVIMHDRLHGHGCARSPNQFAN